MTIFSSLEMSICGPKYDVYAKESVFFQALCNSDIGSLVLLHPVIGATSTIDDLACYADDHPTRFPFSII